MTPKKKAITDNITFVRSSATSADIVSLSLNILNRGVGLSFARISSLSGGNPFSGIPPGTLSTIAKTSKVPKVWEKQLRIKKHSRPRFTGHKLNMQSLASSIFSQVQDQKKIKLLIDILSVKLEGEEN